MYPVFNSTVGTTGRIYCILIYNNQPVYPNMNNTDDEIESCLEFYLCSIPEISGSNHQDKQII